MEAGFETTNFTEGQGEKIEEQGPLRLCRQGDHLPFGVGGGLLVNELQVGRFAAQAGTVIDNLAVYFARRVIDKSLNMSLIIDYAPTRIWFSLLRSLWSLVIKGAKDNRKSQ